MFHPHKYTPVFGIDSLRSPQLYQTKEEDLSTILLSIPNVGRYEEGEKGHDRFKTVVEIVSRYLCFFKADSTFGLVHFNPLYNRACIHPVDQPSYGNLPPEGWINPMFSHISAPDTLTPSEVSLSNYQRRSPYTMINILRGSQLDMATGGKSVVKLRVGEEVVDASGVGTYVRNARKMRDYGEEFLKDMLEREIRGEGEEGWERYYSEEVRMGDNS